jgi:hypothetical protein
MHATKHVAACQLIRIIVERSWAVILADINADIQLAGIRA